MSFHRCGGLIVCASLEAQEMKPQAIGVSTDFAELPPQINQTRSHCKNEFHFPSQGGCILFSTHQDWGLIELRNRLTIAANRMLFNSVPDWLYLRLALNLIPLLDERRRGMATRVERFDGGFVARNETGTWHFNSAFKIGRYLYKDARNGIASAMLNKYSDGSVQVEQGDLVVDIGANVGEFSVGAAEKGAHVIAIEPDESAFRCLERNTSALENITCEAALIGDLDGSKLLYLSPAFSDSSVIPPTEKWSETREVRSLTLASLMRNHHTETIDFLKVEAEGFEPEILQAAKDVLPKIRKIAIDASPEREGRPTDKACSALLSANGFDVWQRGYMVFALNRSDAKNKAS